MLNREIETFLAVVAAGSVNKAARLLNITQSSVSQRLKKLEEDVGSVLIDRRKGGRSIQLTHAGESFFLVAENMQTMLQRLSETPSTGGSLKIGCVDSVNIFLLERHVQENAASFAAGAARHRNPSIRTDIRSRRTTGTRYRVRSAGKAITAPPGHAVPEGGNACDESRTGESARNRPAGRS